MHICMYGYMYDRPTNAPPTCIYRCCIHVSPRHIHPHCIVTPVYVCVSIFLHIWLNARQTHERTSQMPTPTAYMYNSVTPKPTPSSYLCMCVHTHMIIYSTDTWAHRRHASQTYVCVCLYAYVIKYKTDNWADRQTIAPLTCRYLHTYCITSIHIVLPP